MVDITSAEFEELVSDAIDSVPGELLDLIDNAVILVEDEPPPDEPPDLLGLYDGVALTDRWDAAGYLPDRIMIFEGPLRRYCTDRKDLVEQVRITVVHEIAHHFGIDNDRLHELGWG